ncbi:MAG: rod shape-determining protein RodA [Planctomycetota bacterium]|jgi:rod shape determining protein RodA
MQGLGVITGGERRIAEKERTRLQEMLEGVWRAVRGPIPLLLLALLVFGWLSIWSASWKSGEAGEGQYLNYYLRQLLWIAVGIGVYFASAIPSYLKISRWTWILYGAGIAGLVAVFAVGTVINGSRRWILLGPIQVQPSEFAKLAVVLGLAKYLMYRRNLDTWWKLLPPFLIVAVPLVLILKEPDLGTSLLLVPVLGAMLIVSGASKRHLAIAAALGLGLAVFSYFFLLKEYQVKRVHAFLYQGSYSRSQKIGEAYQLIQSKIAMGSGGWTGKGWCGGTQNMLNFTPFRHTDFIFAVVGEEWGFVGASAMLLLYLLIFALSLSAASRTREPFGRLLVTGLVTLLAVQVCINVGMALGLAPITGLTLPFVSYGGSSMVSSFAAIGLIANVASRRIRVIASG